jgi:hypothetical protein
VAVDEGLTTAIIDQKLVRLGEEMDRIRHEAGGTEEELTMAWRKAEDEYNEAAKDWKIMDQFKEVCHYFSSFALSLAAD